MGSGGGELGEATKTFKADPWGELLKGAVNYATLGLAQTNGRGGIERGALIHGTDEFVGGITGRNLARKAGYEQKDALAVAQAKAQLDLNNQNLKKQQMDVSASQAAAANVASSNKNFNPTFTPPSGTGLNGGAKDFLGL